MWKLGDLLHDVMVGTRRLLRRPWSNLTMVLILAIGIAGATLVTSFIQAVISRPASGTNPGERTVRIRGIRIIHGLTDSLYPRALTERECSVLHAETGLFSRVACWTVSVATLRFAGDSYPIPVTLFAADTGLMALVGARFDTSRLVRRTWDAQNSESPVFISYQLREFVFPPDSEVIGRSILLNGHSVQVAGVGPQGFLGPIGKQGRLPLWYLSGSATEPGTPLTGDVGVTSRDAIAELRPGVTLDSANKAVAELSFHGDAVQSVGASARSITADVVPLRGQTILPKSADESAFYAKYGGTVEALVLLLVVINVAALAAGNAIPRRLEFAIRMSIGASRGRIVGQLLMEQVILGLLGGCLGVVIFIAIRSSIQEAAPGLSFTLGIGTFLIVGAIVATVSALAMIGPALEATQVEPQQVLNVGGSTSTTAATLQEKFLVGQTALAIPLVLALGLLSWQGMLSRHSDGIATEDANHLMILRFNGMSAKGKGPQATLRIDSLLSSIAAQSSIEGAVPLPSGRGRITLFHQGRKYQAEAHRVSPSQFTLEGRRLERGRDFVSWDDTLGSYTRVVINASMAEKLFRQVNPVGAVVRARRESASHDDSVEIIGVAAPGQMVGLGDETPDLIRIAGIPQIHDEYLIRTREPAAGVLSMILASFQRSVPELLPEVATVLQRRRDAASESSWSATFAAALGLVVTLFSVLGLYAAINLAVIARWREIGIRITLGGSPLSIALLFVSRGLRICLRAAMLGLIPCVLAIMLFIGEVSLWPRIAVIWLGVVAIFMTVAATTSFIAALPAMLMNPAEVLRNE